VKVAKAEKATIAAPVTAVGTIWPREKADVSAKISAQIKSMALLKNKLVRAGQVIAVLESRDLQAQSGGCRGAQRSTSKRTQSHHRHDSKNKRGRPKSTERRSCQGQQRTRDLRTSSRPV